jgi:uncharacterized membrane protein YhiD involved in acid resistance
MAAGAGYYWPALAGTLLTLFALWPLRGLRWVALERSRPPERRLVVDLREGASVRDLLDLVPDVRQVEVQDQRDRRIVTLELVNAVDEQLAAGLADRDDVMAVRWRK